MSKTDVMRKIVDLANVAEPLPPDEANAAVAGLIGHLDERNDCYDLEVAVLVRIGATIMRLSEQPSAVGQGLMLRRPQGETAEG